MNLGSFLAKASEFWSKFIRWIICIVVVSSAPVLFKWLDLIWYENEVTRVLLIGDGELFLITCALAGAGIAETFGFGKLKPLPLTAGLGCILSVGGTSYAYNHF